MVAHVDGAGDVARTDAVADLANDGGAVTKLVYSGAVGSLAHSADHGFSRHQHFFSFGIFADHALGSDFQTLVAGMCLHYFSTICIRIGR